MKNKNLFVVLIFLLTCSTKIFAENFIFETTEIQLSDGGNIISAAKGTVISKFDKLEIEAETFQYNKKKLILTATNGVARLPNENIKIKANQFLYDQNLYVLTATGNVEIRDITNKLLIESESISFNSKSKYMKSESDSTIEDNNGNFFSTKKFSYSPDVRIIKFTDVELIDVEKNITKIRNMYLNLNTNQILGKDFSMDFNNDSFNKNNDPRLKGNAFSSKDDISIISKGIFTTCKKNDTCPPWQISAKKITHNKKKQILYYDNAWLKLYDVPVLYFPKFFHPDPSVKRQSGFLMPSVVSSSNLGSAFNLPYYQVIADNKDMTISPRLYADQKILLQAEYREENKKSKHTVDFGSVINKGETDKNHFFSKYIKNIDFFSFDDTDLKLNLQLSSDETYLKAYKITSPLITNRNLLNSSIEIDAYSEDLTFNSNLRVIKDLSKKDDDRYEFIYPSYNLSKKLNHINLFKGDYVLDSNGYMKNYEGNTYEKIITNDLKFSSDSSLSKSGIVNKYNFLIKNVNTDTKNSSKYKSKTNYEIASIFEYNLSYPLIKNKKDTYSILNPLTSIRFSPNKNKDMRNDSKRIDANNIFNLNRLALTDAVEGGASLTYGLEYFKNDKKDKEILKSSIANVIRLENNDSLPSESKLGGKNSDIVGSLNYIPNHILKINYDFSLDNNLTNTNYQLFGTEITINNFITSFEYLNDNNSTVKDSFYTSRSSLAIDESKNISFETRKNKKTDLTEFYNLIYQYRNDCLIAAIEYNKDYYDDGDLKPEENIFFKLTIVPFGQTSTPNLLN